MKYFTIKELCLSKTADIYKINNTPSKELEENLIKLVDNILDPLREAYGKPIIVNSGFRCTVLNRLVGGVFSSQHRLGEAADITVGSVEKNKELFKLIISLDLPFDQLINEKNYSWIHVSYGPRNRKQILNA